MGLKGEAAIVGYVEWKPERRGARRREFNIEQWARLTKGALDDAGISAEQVNGIVTSAIQESAMFVPATVSEYLGIPVDFAEYVDLGGATGAGMIWRAAAAVELGIADVVVCAAPSSPVPQPPTASPPDRRWRLGASSN